MHSNMGKDTTLPVPPDCLLFELDALTAIVGKMEDLLCLANQRQKQLFAALDFMTAPLISIPIGVVEYEKSADPSLSAPPGPRAADRLKRGYDYRGKTKRCWEEKDIWIGVMSRLIHDYPESHADIQQALKSKGRTRTYFSRTPSGLFPNKSHEWSKKHSVQIPGGWFLDKNLSGDRMKSLLRTAVEAVGLTWGLDVVVRLYSLSPARK
ncbi:MAG: hypothetical protein JNJ44_06470 [Zoogloeaceae bacterium]|nr:hypothetical protein [Zoogloeaceae bacterium]